MWHRTQAVLSCGLLLGCGGFDGYSLRGDSALLATSPPLVLAQAELSPERASVMEYEAPPKYEPPPRPVSRRENGKKLLITGGVFGIIAVGSTIGGVGWAVAQCTHSRDSFCSVGGGLFGGTMLAIHLPISVVLFGVGGYRYTH